MSISTAIAEHRSALISCLLETADRSLPTPEAEVRQFLVGFVALMQAAAEGDLGPRDEYLESVIPAVRESGISLGYVVGAMPRLATAIGCVLGREHAPWVANFTADYTLRLLALWQRPVVREPGGVLR
jgi:hypothetical protein